MSSNRFRHFYLHENKTPSLETTTFVNKNLSSDVPTNYKIASELKRVVPVPSQGER